MCTQKKECIYTPLPSTPTLLLSERRRDGLSSKHRTMLEQHNPAVLTAVFQDPLKGGERRASQHQAHRGAAG